MKMIVTKIMIMVMIMIMILILILIMTLYNRFGDFEGRSSSETLPVQNVHGPPGPASVAKSTAVAAARLGAPLLDERSADRLLRGARGERCCSGLRYPNTDSF